MCTSESAIMVPIMSQDPVKLLQALCLFKNVYKHSITASTKSIPHIKTVDEVQLWVQKGRIGSRLWLQLLFSFSVYLLSYFFSESALGLDIEPL